MKLFRTRVVKNDGDYVGSEFYEYIFTIEHWRWTEPFTWKDISHERFTVLPTAESTAKNQALLLNGVYVGVFNPREKKRKSFLRKIQNFIRLNLMGPTGMPGAPGPQGPMGLMGPAYDDVQCPHCTCRRSQTKRTLFMEVMGGGKFVYTCGSCKKVSLWTPVGGVWVADKVETKEKAYD